MYTREYYSATKGKKPCHLQQHGHIDSHMITLSEVSQKGKDKYYIISLTCRIQNATQINLSMKQ